MNEVASMQKKAHVSLDAHFDGVARTERGRAVRNFDGLDVGKRRDAAATRLLATLCAVEQSNVVFQNTRLFSR